MSRQWSPLTHFMEHKLLLVFFEELRRPRLVEEERVDALDVVDAHLGALRHQPANHPTYDAR